MRMIRHCLAPIALVILAGVAATTSLHAQSVPPHAEGASKATEPVLNGSAPKGSADTAKPVPSANEQLRGFQATQNADYNFASLLRLQRLAALELAQEELAHGKDPALRAIAGKLVASHKKGIEPLDQWLDQFRRFD